VKWDCSCTGIHSARVAVVEGPAELIEVSATDSCKPCSFRRVDLAMEMAVAGEAMRGNRAQGDRPAP